MIAGMFRPGPLSLTDADRLTRLERQVDALARLTAAPPLRVRTPGGVPVVSLDAGAGGAALSSQQAGLISGFTLTGASNTWQDVTGLSLTVAATGLHLVMYSLSALIYASNPAGITARLRQTGAVTANRIQRYVCRAPVGGTTTGGAGTGAGQEVFDLTAGDVLQVQVNRVFTGTVTASFIPGAGLDGTSNALTIIKLD